MAAPPAAGDEAALSTERALREDADDAARVERSQHALDGAGVGTLEVDGDGPDPPVKERVQWARAIDARHDEERDRPRHGGAEEDAIEVVVMIRREDERPRGGQALEPADPIAEV